jgi:hypothetical protein
LGAWLKFLRARFARDWPQHLPSANPGHAPEMGAHCGAIVPKMRQERSTYFVRSLVVWLGLAYFSNAQSQLCPLITISDLGSITEFSDQGLVARAIVPPGESIPSVPVRVRNFTKVCDAAGERINTSSFVSVVVEFHCDFLSGNQELSVCSDPSTVVTRQYQFQCIEQNRQPVWDTVVSNNVLFVQTLNPTATLSTPLVDTCRRCIDNEQSPSRASINPDTHCDGEFIMLVSLS